jgi:hypothetical protein
VSARCDEGIKTDAYKELDSKFPGRRTRVLAKFPPSIANGRPVYLVEPNKNHLTDLQSRVAQSFEKSVSTMTIALLSSRLNWFGLE